MIIKLNRTELKMPTAILHYDAFVGHLQFPQYMLIVQNQIVASNIASLRTVSYMHVSVDHCYCSKIILLLSAMNYSVNKIHVIWYIDL